MEKKSVSTPDEAVRDLIKAKTQARPTEGGTNAPLPLGELREIAESEEFAAHIWVKDLTDGFVAAAITDVIQEQVAAVWSCSDYYLEKDYGKTWLAYRHKPFV